MQRRKGYTGYTRKVYLSKVKRFIKKQLTRILIVCIILLFLITIKKINNKYTNRMIQIIHEGINYEFNIKESGKKLKLYGKKALNIPEKIVSVFTGNENFNKYPPPIEGNIYKPFGEIKTSQQKTIFNNGVDIIPKKGKKEICAIKDGKIKKIEHKKSLGYFVLISHGDIETVYGHLNEIYIEEGNKIRKGDKIGRIGSNGKGNKYLHFEVWKQNEPIDPKKVVDFHAKYN